MKAALRLLSVRERSEVELRRRLSQKGFDRETVTSTVARLRESGLQDDRRFAGAYATEAASRGGLAAAEVRRRLRGRGVAGDLAAEVATTDPGEEEARARTLAAKRARALGEASHEARFRRLAAFLARRGYPHDLCRRLAEEYAGPVED